MTTQAEVKTHCSNCKKLIDAQTAVSGGGTPNAGHISICAYCAQVGVFNKDISLRNITQKELQEIENVAPEVFKQIQIAVRYIKQMIAKN